MADFVNKGSIVREIWGKADTILFIFAGASAEFAVNKAVDWLYFTGKLPADPLGRLFSTVAYARQIVFSEYDAANRSIDKITAIHQDVEAKRGARIPDWAYRDVLFMLIDYSIRSFEVLERKLTADEKAEVFAVFYRVGTRMGINGLPHTFTTWEQMRQDHIQANLQPTHFSKDLYLQYRKHLGAARYYLLRQVQILVVPPHVNDLLSLGRVPFIAPVISFYKCARLMGLEKYIKNAILPPNYLTQIQSLDAQSKKEPLNV
ncbi:oxygenase MpaB family protein [Dyadobacter sp. 32]|uniref:oxygenase MpaB family protein n=1 Tax=Dyadobacter sp. 32 TaxID=538966 RepID=UPI0011EEC417